MSLHSEGSLMMVETTMSQREDIRLTTVAVTLAKNQCMSNRTCLSGVIVVAVKCRRELESNQFISVQVSGVVLW